MNPLEYSIMDCRNSLVYVKLFTANRSPSIWFRISLTLMHEDFPTGVH
jgi:hypothetical protein